MIADYFGQIDKNNGFITVKVDDLLWLKKNHSKSYLEAKKIYPSLFKKWENEEDLELSLIIFFDFKANP